MKKSIYFAIAMLCMTFASCNNGKTTDVVENDSTVVDSVVVDSVLVDSLAVDSVVAE